MSRIDRPGSVEEALELLARSDARPIAGGVAILLRARLGERPGERHVAIGSLGELRTVEVDVATGDLLVGAAATLAEVAASAVVRAETPLLAGAARAAASLGVRSIATVGGNLVDAPGDSDLVAAALALDGMLEVRRLGTSRLVAPGAPLGRGELMTRLRVPARPGAGWALRRLQTQGAADRPALTVAVVLQAQRGTVTALRAAAVCLGDRALDLSGLAPVVAGAHLADITGGRLDERISSAALAAVDAAVAAGLVLRDDLRASAGYRRSMVGVLAPRAVRDAAATALAPPR